MIKKIFSIFIMILLLVGLTGNVFATDTQTATSTINDITVNWSYELNASNQIEELKCTNTSALTGKITVPSTIEGKTVVTLGNEAFKSATQITEVIIPNTVKEIGYSAFENCTNLSKVNLGSIESISFDVFKGCTSLKEITIPKTLKKGALSPCLNNSNITKITLEEGLTVVPSYLCANTGITEITIPNTVKEIDYSAFENCTNLKKITILDNVTTMGLYNVEKSDSIFKNHSQDLTIYCYKDSMAAEYAIKYNIKYVYLTKTGDTKPIEDNKDGSGENQKGDAPTQPSGDTNKKEDTTVINGILPQTGVNIIITIASFVAIIVVAVIFYKKYNNYKDIK